MGSPITSPISEDYKTGGEKKMLEKTKMTILAGGQGSRFWPVSRMQRPKQFLSVSSDGESLIQSTSRRVVPLVSEENIWIVTNVVHEPMIKEHVPYAKIISEPIGRNTAAAIGLAALHAAYEDPETVLLCLPADHAVSDEEKLRQTLTDVVTLAKEKDLLVTVGIPPTRPDTGYGYIQRGDEIGKNAYRVNRFFEKPSLSRAEKYIEQGGFYWNSGMFGWRASVVLAAIEEFLPALYALLEELRPYIGTDQEEQQTAEVYEKMESISIDFGIMEHARNTAMVEARPYGWNDVGSWDAWAEHFDTDGDGNLLHGDTLAIDSKNCVVSSKDKLIALVGARDLIVIDSGDALLVCPRESVQDVRKVVKVLKEKGRKDLV